MKLNYNILWVEDDNSWYETTAELFKENIEDMGFVPAISRKVSIDEVTDEYEKTGLKKIDILLIDFNLKNSPNGDAIINLVRSKEIYTDIIFYSSDLNSVKESMHNFYMEGVYYSDRKDIEHKFDLVFKTTIKKVEEINAMRGLIVGETSELDVCIEQLSLAFVNNILKLDDKTKDEIINKYAEKVAKNGAMVFEKYKEIGFDQYFSLIEATKKIDIFRELLKEISKQRNDEFNSFLTVNKSYHTDVISIRNKFAHSKAQTKGEKEVLLGQLGKEDFEFDAETFKEIRKNILKHREEINKLMTDFNLQA